LYNFPAFDEAAEKLRRAGYEVVSPADLDRQLGFDPSRDEATPDFVRQAIARDLSAVATVDEVCLLPGWETSAGVKVELELAKMLGLNIWEYETGQPLIDQPTICEEANGITQDARNDDYGHPRDNFEHTAALWRAMFGWPVEWYDVARAMVLVKLSRQRNKPKRDNLVDAAGYAQCEQMGWERGK
jgi:hypothetical protein